MNTVNHEYYVSLEVVKLLKEAGFDWECNHYYFTQNDNTEIKSDFRYPAQNYNEVIPTMDSKSFKFEIYSRPTLDVAQRWLREIKNIHIEVSPNSDMSAYIYNILLSKDKFWLGSSISYITYEEAQEAGIKKALKLILEKGE